MAKQAKAIPTVPSIPKSGAKAMTLPSVPKLPPPKHKKDVPRFEIVEAAKSGFHWVLVQGTDKWRGVLAGHCGTNAKTRDEALKQIETFKQMVAQAEIK